MSVNDPTCLCTDVVRGMAEDEQFVDEWACESCGASFYPEGLVLEAQATADAVAATAAALLWDFHERAIEKYGHGITVEEEECSAHIRGDDGVCTKCKDPSPFIGRPA